jgi:hypothetical protein
MKDFIYAVVYGDPATQQYDMLYFDTAEHRQEFIDKLKKDPDCKNWDIRTGIKVD